VLCWSLWTLYLLTYQVGVTVGNSGLCSCCIPGTSFLSANTCVLTWSTSYLRPCHAQGIYEEVSLDITISSKSFTSMGIILYHVSVVEICVKMCFTLDAGCTQQKGWDSITDPPTILHLQCNLLLHVLSKDHKTRVPPWNTWMQFFLNFICGVGGGVLSVQLKSRAHA